MSRRFEEYKYAPPDVGEIRYRARIATLALSRGVSAAARGFTRLANGIANRISRPRCIYPGCRDDVADWCADEYVPIDTDLCEHHQGVYELTVRRWMKQTEGLPDPDFYSAVRRWAEWHAANRTGVRWHS